MKTLTSVTAFAFLAFSAFSPALAASEDGIDNRIEWHKKAAWKLPVKPKSMVHSLDGKKVFVLGDDSKVHIFTPKGDLIGSVPVDQGVSYIDIAPYGEVLFLVNTEEQTFIALAISQIAELEAGNSPFKGPQDAPVIITLFTDFECPFCKKLPPVMDEVMQKNQGDVKLVLKSLPLVRIHPLAKPAAQAALAAHKQGKFWEFHDKLFTIEKLKPEDIDQIAKDLGLDMDAFKKDMASPEIIQQIEQDMQMAQKADVSGTPTVFINGRKAKGRTAEAFQTLIDEELAKIKR